ncbi:peptidoglycan-binding domain-containing protein [Deinococcus planocerae]|uniref:peptidoglycan-binding domain-containing protein n=1 Tax=Deinococcus planocerae TaxID=1737569 RepID=UPI000C7EC41A|nr:peptidoglycan-binding domain-containing protein [Deinococcus planocerae]
MRLALPLLAALLLCPALAAPGPGDVERATTRVAQALDGVLRGCPTSFARIGTPDKRCVGAGGTVEGVRVRLGSALGADLYGVWRSRDEQRSVYNWLRTPGGYVYVRVQPDPDGRAQTLVYLDLPPGSVGATGNGSTGSATGSATPSTTPQGGVSVRRPTPAPAPVTPARPAPRATPQPTAPAAPARTAPQPSPQASAPATPSPGPSTSGNLAPVAFRRTLQLQAQRQNGADVEAVQNRLIALTRPSGGGRGDGWYGPVTAATVRAFQASNGLPVTGRVDQATWNLLFSGEARTFPASAIR